MGKNGGAVLVAAGWSSTPHISKLGIQAKTVAEFAQILQFSAGWSGKWWHSGRYAPLLRQGPCRSLDDEPVERSSRLRREIEEHGQERRNAAECFACDYFTLIADG